MKLSMVCKLDRLVKDRMPKPRLHYFWGHLHETDDMVQARIRAKIASGEASETDEFVIFSWRRPEDDEPVPAPEPANVRDGQ